MCYNKKDKGGVSWCMLLFSHLPSRAPISIKTKINYFYELNDQLQDYLL